MTDPKHSLSVPEDAAWAAAELFKKRASEVFRMAVKLAGDRSLAEDLVQETFMAAFQAWDRLADLTEDQRRAWLYRTLHNRALDQFRRANQTRRAATPTAPIPVPSAENQALEKIIAARALKLIDELPPQQRKIALLRWRSGFTSAEIAEQLGLSTGTVLATIHHVRQKLKQQLIDPGIEPLSEEELTESES